MTFGPAVGAPESIVRRDKKLAVPGARRRLVAWEIKPLCLAGV